MFLHYKIDSMQKMHSNTFHHDLRVPYNKHLQQLTWQYCQKLYALYALLITYNNILLAWTPPPLLTLKLYYILAYQSLHINLCFVFALIIMAACMKRCNHQHILDHIKNVYQQRALSYTVCVQQQWNFFFSENF